jgi:DNA-binding NarL/FixJ family response regulator
VTVQADTPAPTAEVDPKDDTRMRVVLVDARPDRRSVMRQVFEHSGLAATVVAEADTGAEAVALVEEHAARVAVVELPLPAAEGLAAVAELRGRLPDLVIVVISFSADPAVKEQALAGGADAYLVKPVSAREVMAAVPAPVTTD